MCSLVFSRTAVSALARDSVSVIATAVAHAARHNLICKHSWERKKGEKAIEKKKKKQQKESQIRIRGLCVWWLSAGIFDTKAELNKQVLITVLETRLLNITPETLQRCGSIYEGGFGALQCPSLWSKLLVVHMRRKQIGNAVLHRRNWRWCPALGFWGCWIATSLWGVWSTE